MVLLSGQLGLRINRHPLAVFTEVFKSYYAVNLGEQGVVTPAANIGSRMDFGAELANQDAARCYDLTAKAFYSTSLPCTIAAIP